MHEHKWTTTSQTNQKHKEGDKYLTYIFIQICECGTYQYKDFKHLEDKGDDYEN